MAGFGNSFKAVIRKVQRTGRRAEVAFHGGKVVYRGLHSDENILTKPVLDAITKSSTKIN